MTNQVDQAVRLAHLHAAAFENSGTAPWTATTFASLLAQSGVFAVEAADGFILMRVAADEAEVLTLAVRPKAQRTGAGSRLTESGVVEAAARGATRVFLEVAEDNAAALGLYAKSGFTEAGRRPGYYARKDGTRQDALLLVLNLSDTLP